MKDEKLFLRKKKDERLKTFLKKKDDRWKSKNKKMNDVERKKKVSESKMKEVLPWSVKL